MAAWLDMAIVGAALVAASAATWRIYRRGQGSACATSCGACAPPTQKNQLVQIGGKGDRPFLAGSRGNR